LPLTDASEPPSSVANLPVNKIGEDEEESLSRRELERAALAREFNSDPILRRRRKVSLENCPLSLFPVVSKLLAGLAPTFGHKSSATLAIAAPSSR
jgi:hypothetical protein